MLFCLCENSDAGARTLGSSLLVAFTDTRVMTPTPGARNCPPEVTVPFVTDQVTSWFIVPDTTAVKCCPAPDLRVTVAGLIETEIGENPGGIGG